VNKMHTEKRGLRENEVRWAIDLGVLTICSLLVGIALILAALCLADAFVPAERLDEAAAIKERVIIGGAVVIGVVVVGIAAVLAAAWVRGKAP
jgi:hypothetical protein